MHVCIFVPWFKHMVSPVIKNFHFAAMELQDLYDPSVEFWSFCLKCDQAGFWSCDGKVSGTRILKTGVCKRCRQFKRDPCLLPPVVVYSTDRLKTLDGAPYMTIESALALCRFSTPLQDLYHIFLDIRNTLVNKHVSLDQRDAWRAYKGDVAAKKWCGLLVHCATAIPVAEDFAEECVAKVAPHGSKCGRNAFAHRDGLWYCAHHLKQWELCDDMHVEVVHEVLKDYGPDHEYPQGFCARCGFWHNVRFSSRRYYTDW